MSTTNFTRGGTKTKIFQELQCYPSLIGGLQSALGFFAAVNIFLAITAFLGNSLILVALHWGILPSSAVQTLVSLSGNNWPVGWSCCSASPCYLLDVRGSRTLEPLSLRRRSSLHYRRSIMWSFFADDGGNKRGQASCPVVGAEIQRDCNFEAYLYHYS